MFHIRQIRHATIGLIPVLLACYTQAPIEPLDLPVTRDRDAPIHDEGGSRTGQAWTLDGDHIVFDRAWILHPDTLLPDLGARWELNRARARARLAEVEFSADEQRPTRVQRVPVDSVAHLYARSFSTRRTLFAVGAPVVGLLIARLILSARGEMRLGG